MRNQGIMFIMGLVHSRVTVSDGWIWPPTHATGRNSIKNSRIRSGCHFTPQELLWPQVVLNSSCNNEPLWRRTY